MKSIIAHLGTENFPRIRVGIGEKPERMDLADYVLGHFSKEEMENLQKATHMAAEAAEILITQDAQTAMNRFNKVKKETP
jgi:PTH1 family peptidyl-tRNA hydrolase